MEKISELIIDKIYKKLAFCKHCNKFFIDDIKKRIKINCPCCYSFLKRGFTTNSFECGHIYYRGKKVYWDRKKKQPSTHKTNKSIEDFMLEKGFKKSITESKTLPITLLHIKTNYFWHLYQIGKALYIKDTEPRYGGYFKMFENIKEAKEKGWKVVK